MVDSAILDCCHGFLLSQVVRSHGYPVKPGLTYTLRLGVADIFTGGSDSLLLVPYKSMQLAEPPFAFAAGPYTAVSKGGGGWREGNASRGRSYS